MKKPYNNIFTDIKAMGNINGVPWAFGSYKHFVPRCNNILIVGNIIFPIVDGEEVTENVVTEIVTKLIKKRIIVTELKKS